MTKEELEVMLTRILTNSSHAITQQVGGRQNLLTRKQVALKFDISLASLHNWVRDGLIPKPIRIARRVYFEEEVITEAINKLRKNKI